VSELYPSLHYRIIEAMSSIFYLLRLLIWSQLLVSLESFALFQSGIGSGGRCTSLSSSSLRLSKAYTVGSRIDTPQSIAAMMKAASVSIASTYNDMILNDDSNNICLVDVPIPAVGSTELDEWPGGIRQKYSVLLPMITEMMTHLNFSSSQIKQSNFLGITEDAIGIWENDKYIITTFASVDLIDQISQMDRKKLVVLVNQNFFLDPLSSDKSKDFLSSATVAYRLEKLNMRGPGGLSVRGILYREYPSDFLIARRLDNGYYTLLATSKILPLINELNKIYYDDSVVRDKELSLMVTHSHLLTLREHLLTHTHSLRTA